MTAPRGAREVVVDAREQGVEAAMGEALCRLLADGTAFTEISVDQIVREAGVARSTFYVYFDDKASLLRSLGNIAVAEILGAMAGWTSAPAAPTRASLETLVTEAVQAYMAHRAIVTAMMEISSFDRLASVQFNHYLADAIAGLEAHIRSGQVAGGVSRSVDAHRMAEWLVGMAERGLSRLPRLTGTASTEAIVTSLTPILWNVLYRDREN